MDNKKNKVRSMWDLNNIYQEQCVRTGFDTILPIPLDKFELIREAINNVLNDEPGPAITNEDIARALATIHTFVKENFCALPVTSEEMIAVKEAFYRDIIKNDSVRKASAGWDLFVKIHEDKPSSDERDLTPKELFALQYCAWYSHADDAAFINRKGCRPMK